ncbi:MAG: hypothetical protein JRJ85_24485 [Deltaproteobacteria bacterium]|nr:hypothetical protein [Deltaproteobacteria bacterium]
MSNDMIDLDFMDVQSMGACDVLKHFGIVEPLPEWEQALLMIEIEKLAERFQTAEIISTVSQA